MRAECALHRHNVLPQSQDKDGALVVAAVNERAAFPLACQAILQTRQTTQTPQTTWVQVHGSTSPPRSTGDQQKSQSVPQREIPYLKSAATSDNTARIS